MSQYEVYDTSGGDVPREPVGGAWMVAVEYSNAADAKPPTIIDVLDGVHATREDALAVAHEAALRYDPPDPYAPQGREVFRDGPDGFLVFVHGAMKTFHMSVRVVEHLGSA